VIRILLVSIELVAEMEVDVVVVVKAEIDTRMVIDTSFGMMSYRQMIRKKKEKKIFLEKKDTQGISGNISASRENKDTFENEDTLGN